MNKALRAIIRAKHERYAARVVRLLRRTPSREWQPDAYPCRTLWDHWKMEQQEEHSVMHDAIEEMVETTVQRVVDQLPFDEVALLSLDSPDIEDRDEPVADPEYVESELLRKVASLANDEPHRAEVQKMLDGQASDRLERDMEGY
ncbi:MAG: hypothetical protein AB7G11_04780 [Phycisphaerales bacterium]